MTLPDVENLETSSGLGLEVKAAPDGRIEGYASTFDLKPDRQGHVIAAGAFARTLAEHKAEGTVPALLWMHDYRQPIGRWDELREDGKGLHVQGRLNLKTARGQEAYEHISSGDVAGLSIGFITSPGGRQSAPGGISLITEVDLVEISVVTTPANPRARITGAKSVNTKAELVTLLREAGLAKAAAARVAGGGWPALAGSGNHHEQAIQLAALIDQATARLKGL